PHALVRYSRRVQRSARACSSTADQARSRAAASAGVAGRGQYSPFVVESSLMGSAGAGSRSDFRMVTSTSHELTLFGRTRTPRPGDRGGTQLREALDPRDSPPRRVARLLRGRAGRAGIVSEHALELSALVE